jgi:glycosyltransferase involved in cell wall biosynthesis
VKVLYVNHTATIAGGELSLLGVLETLPAAVDAVLATPLGPLADRASVRTVEVPPVEATFSGGVLGGVRSIATAARALRRVTAAERPDIVHANSVRAGLVASVARLHPPLVVSVRDCLPSSRVSRATRRLIHRRAALVIANSQYTAAAFPGRASTIVIYPGVDLGPYAAEVQPSIARAREDLGLDGVGPVLGVIGQLTPWKGQDDAIRILAALRERLPGAVLLIVGEAKFLRATWDNRAYERRLRELSGELGLDDAVRFLGDRQDVPRVMRALDLLLVPSWEEPFGRTVVEGLAAGVPVAATAIGGPAETLAGVESALLPPRQPTSWIEPVENLLGVDARAPAADARRREAAAQFSAERQTLRLVAAYEAVVSGSSTGE